MSAVIPTSSSHQDATCMTSALISVRPIPAHQTPFSPSWTAVNPCSFYFRSWAAATLTNTTAIATNLSIPKNAAAPPPSTCAYEYQTSAAPLPRGNTRHHHQIPPHQPRIHGTHHSHCITHPILHSGSTNLIMSHLSRCRLHLPINIHRQESAMVAEA